MLKTQEISLLSKPVVLSFLVKRSGGITGWTNVERWFVYLNVCCITVLATLWDYTGLAGNNIGS
ncbi:MAG: hypothetical protein KatS3mg058_3456 [Roseiflexus sp.]|nr:MAG: hypothetical protein KatS3mg058_3456 [Roseiflexus sp.]